MKKKHVIIVVLATFCLIATLALVRFSESAMPYDPWGDVSGPIVGEPDGTINMRDIQYEILHFNTFGTPIDKSSLMSIEYDSDWINITDKCGQYFDVAHNLNSTDAIVDITGKTTLDGGVHQRNLGGTGYTPGWTKTYGGIGREEARSGIQTSDGGYALVGHTTSATAGSFDFWFIRTDANGNMLWSKTYGGIDNDQANSVIQTSDGGYAITGHTNSYGAGQSDFWLIKTDANGNAQWNKTYGGTGVDWPYSVIQTGDGGYAVGGVTTSYSTSYDFWLVKTDASGNAQWNKTYGGTGFDEGWSVIQTSDGGYAIAGETRSYGAGIGDFWLVKTADNGITQWNKTYGGITSDKAHCVVQTSDGGYAIAGDTSISDYDDDAWLVKTDANGNAQWNKTYGGSNGDYAYSVVQTSEGGYAMGGCTWSYGAFQGDFWQIKTDANGNTLWSRAHGVMGDDWGYSIVQTSDGGCAIAGHTYISGSNFDFCLVKTETEFGLMWTDSTADTITLYRGATDPYWNFVRVRIWKPM